MKLPGRILSLAVVAFALAASPAAADGLLAPLDGCPPTRARQVFLPFADPLWYSLAPNGGFEDGATGWSLSGARVVAGNESYDLNSDSDSASLSLGAGASATSPATCVSLLHPTLRFVARSTGSALGILKVDALYRDGQSLLDVVPVGIVTGLGSGWKPSLPMVLSAGLVPSLGSNAAAVRFRFTSGGLGGAFQIDDVFVDPYGRG